MNNQPLLTVIIPCYNVEKYIDKCISSVVAQTYSNLEILLVNDGSTDETEKICDAWQEKDSRIRVIHKQNEGASYARKTGIEHATADYVTFVDSDDWIDKNMYSDMMTALLDTNSDIAQCGYCKVFEDGRIENHPDESKNDSFEVIGREEGVLLILEDEKWKSFMWNKIYKKRLFDHVVFPKELDVAEDFINHSLFHNASQSVYLPNVYYFYYQRDGSLLNYNTIQSKIIHKYHFSQNLYSRYLFVQQHPQYHSILHNIKERNVNHGFISLRYMVGYPQYACDEWFKTQVRQIRSIALSRKNVLPLGTKLDLFLLKIHPICFIMFRKLYYLFKKCDR